jgi:hypothetical protein
MKLALIFFFIISLVSCSHVEFVNTSDVPIRFNGKLGHVVEYKKELETHFYLWGTLPDKVTIDFKNIIEEFDLKSVSSLQIKRVNKASSYFWPIFTFGFVVPRYYELSFKVPKEGIF